MGTNKFRSCRHCSNSFEVTKEWQLFCSDPCRKRWNYNESGYCFYCGEAGAIHRDHLYPVSAITPHKSQWNAIRRTDKHETVPACVECNSTLSDKVFDDVVTRVKWLAERYEDKYKLRVGAVLWSENEIEELGPALRNRIKHMLAKRQKAERRVAYIYAVATEIRRLNALGKITLENTQSNLDLLKQL